MNFAGEHFRVDSAELWDPSAQAAIRRAHDQFRWFGSGWKVNAELVARPA